MWRAARRPQDDGSFGYQAARAQNGHRVRTEDHGNLFLLLRFCGL
jgi:hypothetical protein